MQQKIGSINIPLHTVIIGLCLALASVALLSAFCGRSNDTEEPVAEGLSSTSESATEPEETTMHEKVRGETTQRGAGTRCERLAGVSGVSLELANGQVSFDNAELDPGTVEVEWEVLCEHDTSRCTPEDLEVTLELNSGILTMKDHYTGPSLGQRPEIEVQIKAHRDVEVAATLGNGTLQLASSLIAGANLGNGTLSLEGSLTDDARPSLGNGRITGNLLLDSGRYAVTLGNGEIALSLLPESSFQLRATVGIGSIRVKGIETKRNWHMLGGAVTGQVGQGAGELEVSVGVGSILLDVS